jgi:hypothetical protein
MAGANSMKYQLYIVKKFYIPLEVEADSPSEAEEKGYEFIDGKDEFNSDDTYIHNNGEFKHEIFNN